MMNGAPWYSAAAIVTLARERPSFLEDPDRVLDLATDLALGGLLAIRRRAEERS